MKKAYLLFVSLIALCLYGCHQSESGVATIQPETSPSVMQTIPQDVGQNSAAIASHLYAEEYNQNISVLKATYKNFITYDTIKICGAFDDFSHSSKYDTGLAYRYYFEDENSFHYSFSVVHGETIGLDMEDLHIHENQADLRFNGNHSGYYYVGNVRYAYYEGKLYNIRWTIDDRTILIQAGKDYLHNYPLGVETFMSRLLNAETAEATVAEFNAKIAAARQDTEVKGME